jgi:transcription initiation factor IIE alpha subunit|tara:strand:+ start:2136 stop:2393 length:258 start_codon:yes stop_codon:yes gene_type:complete
MTTETQAQRVINVLKNGVELTAKQITARYGVKNVRAVISQLRSEGYAIFLNKRVSSFDGETYSKYRLGTPTRATVAAGFAALRTA